MANTRALEFLRKLTRYENPMPDKEYTDDPTSGVMDVDLMVNSKPCWEKMQVADASRPKKLIITNLSVRYGIETLSTENRQTLWEFLLEQGVEVYVWTGKPTKVTDVSTLIDALKSVEKIEHKDLITELAKHKISKDECEFIDAQREKEISFELEPLIPSLYVSSPIIELDLNSNEMMPFIETLRKEADINIRIKESKIHLLHYLITSRQKINSIRYEGELGNLAYIFDKDKTYAFDKDKYEKSIQEINQIHIEPTMNFYYEDFRELLSLVSSQTKIIFYLYNRNILERVKESKSFTHPIEINLSRSDLISDQDFSKLLSYCSNLNELSLMSNKLINGSFVEDLKPLDSLKILELNKQEINNAQFVKLLKYCPNIEKLILIECNKLDGAFIQSIHSLDKLINLHINACSFSGIEIAKLIEKCPALDSLHLSKSRFTMKELGEYLSKSPNLSYFRIYDCELLGDEPFSIQGNLSNLTQLDIDALFLRDQTQKEKYFELLLHLLPHCQKLEELSFVVPLHPSFDFFQYAHASEINLEDLKKLQVSSISANQLNFLLSRSSNLSDLAIGNVQDVNTSVTFPLKKLTNVKIYGTILADQLAFLLSQSPNITDLKISTVDGLSSFSNTFSLNKLTHLEIDRISTGELVKLLALCPNLKTLKLKKIEGTTIPSILEVPFLLRKLRELDIGEIPQMSTKEFSWLVSHCPNLVEIKLGNFLEEEFFSNEQPFVLNKLSVLNLEKATTISPDQLRHIVLRSPNLTKLSLAQLNERERIKFILEFISDPPNPGLNHIKEFDIKELWFRIADKSITDEQFEYVLTRCPHLEKLNLDMSGAMCDNLKTPFLNGNYSLKSLKEVTWNPHIIDPKGLSRLIDAAHPDLKIISSYLPGKLIADSQFKVRNLKKFDTEAIYFNSDIVTGRRLSYILKYSPNLTKLALFGGSVEGELPFDPAFRHDKLDFLDIAKTKLTAKQLESIVAHCPNLKKLELRDMPFTAAEIFKILLHCKNLQEIKLDCLNKSEINELHKIFPKLIINNSNQPFNVGRKPTLDRNISSNSPPFNLASEWLKEALTSSQGFNADLANRDSSIGDSSFRMSDQLDPGFKNFLENFVSKQKPPSDWNQTYHPSPLDTNTKKPDHPLHARELFEAKGKNNPDPSLFRLQVYPDIELGKVVKYSERPYDIKAVKTFSETNKQLHDLYIKKYKSTLDTYYGQIELPLNQQEWFPLPSLTTKDEILDLTSNVPLQLGYCKEKALYYVKPLTKSTEPVAVSFILKANTKEFVFSKKIVPIDFQSLNFTRDGKLEKNRAYQNVMKQIQKLKPDDVISSLAKFCQSFKEGDLKVASDHGMDKLNALLHSKPPMGACRHATWLFMALAKELNIVARAVENDCHAFVEVSDPKGNWSRLNLGGLEAELQLQPMAKPEVKRIVEKAEIEEKIETNTKPIENETDESPINTEESSINTVERTKPFELSPNNPFKTWDTIKSNAKDYEEYCKDIMSAANGLPPTKRNVLVALEADQIETFHAQMTKYLYDTKQNSFYLHSLGNVNEKEAKVENTKLETPDSELIDFAKYAKKGDALISNWSDYKPAYVGYNTMLDDDRKMRSSDISSEAVVMMVIDKNKMAEMGEDFYSRFRMISECPPFADKVDLIEKLALKENQNIDKFEEAEFFDSDWRNLLLGRINVNGHEFIAQQGLLTKAIKENKPGIVLQNAPWHKADFRIFISELLYKKSFRVNGETIHVPDNFTVTTTTKPYVLTSDKIQPAKSDVKESEQIILNSETFKYFLRYIQCKDNQIFTKSGLIEANAKKSLNVCVTETLPKSTWAYLINLAEKHQCTLHLTLAPNVSLPEEMATIEKDAPKLAAQAKQTKIITTNDLELAEEEALIENPQATVISINKKLQFSDLIEKPVKVPGTDVKSLAFTSTIGSVWERLDNGETVILKGSLSPILARQFESLFLSPPYLWINGEKKELKGKLIILSDQEHALSFTQAEQKTYYETDYWNLLDKKHHDLPAYKKFKTSLENLRKENPSVQFSYGQLKTMTDKLAKGSLSNPFKPFFRMDPNDPVLVSAKNAWEKPAKDKSGDVMARRHQKITSELDVSPYLFIVGPSGVGKSTYVLEELNKENRDVYVGIDNLEKWLIACRDDKSKKHILFIDEANLEKEGAWDVLEGLFNKTPGVLLNGKFYPISPEENANVIFGGNFKNFAGREQHRFFDRHGQVFNFKEMPDSVLTARVIDPAFNAIRLDENLRQDFNQMLLRTYHELNTKLPDHPLTPRNLKIMCLRAHELMKNHQDMFANDAHAAMKIAILDEVSGLLNKEQKNEFKKSLGIDPQQRKMLREKIYKTASTSLKNFVVTKSRKNALNLLHKQFSMREMILTRPELKSFDIPSLLFEGMPGIGKSRMAIEYLKSQGFRSGSLTEENKEVDTTKLYYHITPTDPEKMKTILLKAFHEGAVVIVDELNSLPLERIMNQVLSGYDLDGKKGKKSFLVIGTQNPISFSARQILSIAFENRFRKDGLKDYPEPELREITAKICNDAVIANNIVNDYIFAKRYAELHNKKPAPTPRDLFAYLAMQGYQLTPIVAALKEEKRVPSTFTFFKPADLTFVEQPAQVSLAQSKEANTIVSSEVEKERVTVKSQIQDMVEPVSKERMEKTYEQRVDELFIAVKTGRFETVKELLAEDIDPNIVDDRGNTPLLSAASNKFPNIVEILLQHKANPNIENRDGVTPLYAAIQNGYKDIAKLLLENKADPNLGTKHGDTPLFNAIETGNVDMVRLLLTHGAVLDMTNVNGKTPLMLANENRQRGISQVIEAYLNADLQSAELGTPRQKACAKLIDIAASGSPDEFKEAFLILKAIDALVKKYKSIDSEQLTQAFDIAYLTYGKNKLHDCVNNLNDEMERIQRKAKSSAMAYKIFGNFQERITIQELLSGVKQSKSKTKW